MTDEENTILTFTLLFETAFESNDGVSSRLQMSLRRRTEGFHISTPVKIGIKFTDTNNS